MESRITNEQIALFKDFLRKYEPYPLEVLKKLQYDDDDFDEDRVFATRAKKILLENGIDISDCRPE